MKHLLLIFCILLSLSSHAQKKLKYTTNMLPSVSESGSVLYISDRPITNREYLTYIFWINDVYGSDYPQAVVETFPGFLVLNYENYPEGTYSDQNQIKFLMDGSSDFVKNYMFNPKYLDYPVLGLCWIQAMKFNKWLSDRYNEYVLMKKGYLEFNSEQSDEDCFVTESYFTRQYEGYANKQNDITWCMGILIPAFRLPTEGEIQNAGGLINIVSELQSYPKSENTFLKPWSDLYFKSNEHSILVFRPGTEGFPSDWIPLSNPENFDLANIEFEELTLDKFNPGAYYKEVLASMGLEFIPMDNYRDVENYFPEKDSLGQMPFIIIDEYETGMPVTVEHIKNAAYPPQDTTVMTIVRYVLGKKNE